MPVISSPLASRPGPRGGRSAVPLSDATSHRPALDRITRRAPGHQRRKPTFNSAV